MNSMKMMRIVFAPVLGMVLCLAGVVNAADAVPSEKRLPTSVYAYISVPNVDTFKEKYMQTLFGQMVRDPQMADFVTDVTEKISEKIAEFEDEINMPLADLAGIPSGDVTFAVMRPPRSPLAFAVLLDFKDSGDAVDKLLKQVSDELADEGSTEDAYEYADTRVVTYTFAPEDGEETEDDGKEPKPNMVYFVRDNHLVMGSSKPAIESILDRWDGTNERNFSTNEIYSEIISKCSKDIKSPVLKWYINPLDLTRAGLAAAGPEAMQFQMAMGFLPTLGLDAFKAMGGVSDMATGEYDQYSSYMIYVRQPTRAVMNVFHMPASNQTPPDWVSEKTSGYFAFNWDLAGAYDAIETLVDSFRGPGATQQALDGLADQSPGQLHIKDDLIDNLSGKFGVAMVPNDDPDVYEDRLVVSIGVKDMDKAKEMMQVISDEPSFDGEVREFQNEKIFEFDVDAFGDEPIKGGVVVAKDAVMIGSNVTLIESILRGNDSTKPLAKDSAFKRLAAKMPEKTSMIAFQKQAAQLEQVYKSIRSEEIFDEQGGDQVRDVIGDVDFTKLPEFEAIRKYFVPTGSYIVPDENGALFVGFSLKPEDD